MLSSDFLPTDEEPEVGDRLSENEALPVIDKLRGIYSQLTSYPQLMQRRLRIGSSKPKSSAYRVSHQIQRSVIKPSPYRFSHQIQCLQGQFINAAPARSVYKLSTCKVSLQTQHLQGQSSNQAPTGSVSHQTLSFVAATSTLTPLSRTNRLLRSFHYVTSVCV